MPQRKWKLGQFAIHKSGTIFTQDATVRVFFRVSEMLTNICHCHCFPATLSSEKLFKLSGGLLMTIPESMGSLVPAVTQAVVRP